MMDLSREVQDVLQMMRVLDRETSKEAVSSLKSAPQEDFHSNHFMNDLIDVNNIDITDDETWLYESPMKNSTVKDLKEWLYKEASALKDFNFHTNHLTLIREITNIEAKKGIDSRTFTRPKKRLSRPSIEMYNDGYFKMEPSTQFDSNKYIYESESEASTLTSSENAKNLNETADTAASESYISVENDITIVHQSQAPLSFDFSQPTTSSIFDKIVAAAPDIDSFQNMAPPSLVNSLCSSTFTNLMESSMIKNDPVLREIRDADFSEDMLQDCEPPMFKSFTDSCSSLNSDTPEGFLKRTADSTFSRFYKKNISSDKENTLNETYIPENTVILNCTYEKNSSTDNSVIDGSSNSGTIAQSVLQPKADTNITITNPLPVLNGTFRKNMKLNNTFEKSPKCNSNEDLNRTIIISDGVNNTRLNNTKRHSYIIDNRTCDLNQTVNLKRNSVSHSAGSTDSLDYMSSLSSSSKGSNKMLNMAEVDAIVLQQEQSLQQVMSTPKPSSKIINKLWENNYISPISSLDRGDRASDSEGSSNDDYLTVGSSSSSMKTPYGSETQVVTSNKNVEDFTKKREIQKSNPKSLNAIPTKAVSNRKLDNNLSGSYTNLKTVGANFKSSYTNLRPPSSGGTKGSYSNLTSSSNSVKGSYTNLKTMSNHLRGSYTQLKPILTNLPYADTNLKVFNPNTGTQLRKSNQLQLKTSNSAVKVAEVAPTLRNPLIRDQVKSAAAVNANKPKSSGLPRPVSSIPRPMSSRIPAPRSLRPANLHPSSKVSMDCDF